MKPARQLMIRLLTLALAGLCHGLCPEGAQAESCTFAQYGDIHLSGAGTTTTAFLNRLTTFLSTRLGAPVDFVVDTGDVYEKGAPPAVFGAYLKALGRLKVPIYVLRGNHDIAKAFDAAAWKKAMGRDCQFSFVHKGVAFIGFDTAVNEPSWENPAASAETLAWLAAQSAKVPAEMPVVLLTHVPLASKMGLPAVYPLVNRREVLELFKGKKLLSVISGHYHGAKESVEDGILFTTTPTFSPNRENHDKTRGGAVRLFTVEDGKISTRLVAFPDERKEAVKEVKKRK